jgi:hypothetical protein
MKNIFFKIYSIFISGFVSFIIFLNGKTIFNNNTIIKLYGFMMMTVFFSINLFTIMTYLYFIIYKEPMYYWYMLLPPVLSLLINYPIVYNKNTNINILKENTISMQILYTVVIVLCVSFSIYLMIISGNIIHDFNVSPAGVSL